MAATIAGGEAARDPPVRNPGREKGGEGARNPEEPGAAVPPCPTKGKGERNQNGEGGVLAEPAERRPGSERTRRAAEGWSDKPHEGIQKPRRGHWRAWSTGAAGWLDVPTREAGLAVNGGRRLVGGPNAGSWFGGLALVGRGLVGRGGSPSGETWLRRGRLHYTNRTHISGDWL